MNQRINFRISPHSVLKGVEIVEVLLDGKTCAVIYPDQDSDNSIGFVSAHFAGETTYNNQFPEGVKMDTGENHFPPVPAIRISFEFRNWTIDHGQMIRI
ncbi:MAG: hypothetical protein WAX85_02080 [Minisyncoccia bacterium]